MKTSHQLLVAAGAVALVAAFFAARRTSTSSAGVRGMATSWTPQRQAAYRLQLWSEVPPDFWV